MLNNNYTLLTGETVRKNLINLKQITFEVTDTCNLACKYCGYGEFYDHYDRRDNKMLPVNTAIKLLKYLVGLWDSNHSGSYQKNTYISFYGGEPLLNMPFIEKVVAWVESLTISKCNFRFTMTTNAMLLHKHIDYLINHDFNILISLDGNEKNHSYRVDHAGNNSYERVYNNIKHIQHTYPEFFEKHINFNAVLHNRNDYDGLVDFFQREFNKIPTVAELNPMGIRPDRLEEFSTMYHNRAESLHQSTDTQALQDTIFMDNPQTASLCTFLHWHSGNVFKSYNDLLFDKKKKKWIPTGTCRPFEKKMFVTVNGKLLPCERISHQYALGVVDEGHVELDIDRIVEKYNSWYEKYIPQCSKCYNNLICKQCMFYNENLDQSATCNSFMRQRAFDQHTENQYKYLAEHPHLYRKIMEEVIIH